MTIQNGTIVVAFIIATGWIWGTVQTLQKNFAYQQEVDTLTENVELEKLRNENLQYQQQYYRSAEFLELSARQRLGKANPGEKLIILPDSRDIKDPLSAPTSSQSVKKGNNLKQWMEFFFGDKSVS
jgi:cell division protein FtsB